MSMARLKAWVSEVLNVGCFAIGAVKQGNGCRHASAWRPFLAMSASVLRASVACLRASSWMLWAALGRPPRIAAHAFRKRSSNHADPVLFSAISMWYLDTPRAVLAQVGNASPRTDAKHATRANSAIALSTPSSTVPWRACFSANCSRCALVKGHRFCIGITRMAVPVSRWPRVFFASS